MEADDLEFDGYPNRNMGAWCTAHCFTAFQRLWGVRMALRGQWAHNVNMPCIDANMYQQLDY